MTALDEALVQPHDLPLKITKELCAGRTYIVTGANVGLGLEASRHLVAIGARKVIMAVRNLEAGKAALADIEDSTGTKGIAETWHLDLNSNKSVISFATKVVSKLDRIEGVIENAGLAVAKDPSKVEGHHPQITVNVINTLLLAALLLPKLRSDAAKYAYRPRLSLVTSGTALDMAEVWKAIADDPIRRLDENKEPGFAM